LDNVYVISGKAYLIRYFKISPERNSGKSPWDRIQKQVCWPMIYLSSFDYHFPWCLKETFTWCVFKLIICDGRSTAFPQQLWQGKWSLPMY
jgi:hypothetical protein